jgi:putative DNA primase/helicase
VPESYTGDPGPSTRKPAPAPDADDRPASEAWTRHRGALAAWVDQNLVNRRDAWGGYYRDPDGVTRQTTRKADDRVGPKGRERARGPLTLAHLQSHFAAKPDATCGLHSTFRDEAGECWSRWLAIDIDRHGDEGDPAANLKFALAIYAVAMQLGFKPLLLDSNGRGGYHLLVLFDAPAPTALVFGFGQWLVRGWEGFGFDKPPETFPKQPGIPEGKFGNWLRVFGRHHTRDHHTKVWGGFEFLDGVDGVRAILSARGSSPTLIPAEARPDPAAPFDLGLVIARRQALGEAGDLEGKPKREPAGDGTLEPGEDFNRRISWETILRPHGWVLDHESEGVGFWRRPGKDAGQSATTNHNGNDTLYVFTDGTVFRQGGSYSKFGAFTVLEHDGDFTAAARSLSQQGHGTFAAWVERDGGWVKEVRPNPVPKGVRIAKPGEAPPASKLKAKPVGPAPSVNGNGNGRPPGDHLANGHAEQPNRPPSLNQSLAGRPRTDLGNAERLVARHGGDLRYCHPWKKWLTWDGRRFQLDNTAEVRRRARRTVRAIFGEAKTIDDDEARKAHAVWQLASEKRDRLAAMLSLAEAEEGIPVLPENLDQHPWLLNCANGTLDLRTGQLREHRKEDALTQLCPTPYDGDAACPLWLATLETIFSGHQGMIGFIQRLFGYCLTGATTEQILPILFGTGSNGKSTILGVMLKLLGPDYSMKAMPDLLMVKRSETHPTDKADLFGKRLVVAIETEEGARLNESLIKELTGSDPIRARRMREDPWQFDPTHKVLLCTNHEPAVRGTDHAIWRRLKKIEFSVKIADADADKDLPTKLLGELPGVLAWCVQGLRDWQEGGLNPPQEVIEATEEYRRSEDILGAFLNEHCTTIPSLRTKASAIYERYRKWAEASGHQSANQVKFGKAMTERGFTRVSNNGIWYQGIGLQSEESGDY